MVVHETRFMQISLSEANVSEDPILVLPCGHALTMSTLDDQMGMWDYYDGTKDATTGNNTFVRTKPLPSGQVSMVGCPSCRAPIVGIRRYGRRIKYAQVTRCLKKFEMAQATAIYKAGTAFTENQGIREMIPLIVDGISGLVFTSTQEIIQKNLQAMWQMFSGSTPSSGPSASIPQRDEDVTAKSSTKLGSSASDGDFFPNSDIGSLFLYGIPTEQEHIWMKLTEPALRALKAFQEIHRQANESPHRRLYEASAAHLYDFKTRTFVVDSRSVEDVKHMMEECARECGLPPDGHAGPSFVQSIQGRTDVLLLVLQTAMQVFESICLKVYQDHPSVSGWSKFIEDLLQCSVVHSRILRDTVAKGKYHRLEIHAKMSLLNIYLKRMQWLGHRPFDKRNILRKLNRDAAVHDSLTPFKRILQEIQESSQNDLWKECLPKARRLEAWMETACKIALGELKYRPSSAEGEPEFFRPKQIPSDKAGRWHRCPNGHSYMIVNWWVSLQDSTCPDCDARLNDSMHQLHQI
ncbi:hypothetical protein BGZ72_006327 [Mortierella alpina]|nr:hypothetical protein BGZ72_006327 [Mortierella alpina]